MTTGEALVILGMTFVIGLLVGSQLAAARRQIDLAFLASDCGIGVCISSRPSIPASTRSH